MDQLKTTFDRGTTRFSRWMMASLLAAAAGNAWGASNAHTDPSSVEGVPELETITVTAQKREQTAQDVPASLAAFSGKSLENSGVHGVEGLDQVAAGLTVNATQPGQLNLTMRGIANLGYSLLTGPAVGYYQDETPMSAFSQGTPQVAFWDAERVEVLRGPQGTLFGEGSMGGTIRIITNKPDATALAGRAYAGWSKITDGGDGFTERAMVNIPLVHDTLALRVVASNQDLLGWVNVPDIGVKDSNSGKQQDAHVALRWTPIRELTIDLSHDHQRLDNNFPFATSPGVYKPSDVIPLGGPLTELSSAKTHYDLTNLTANYDLGFATIVAAASWFEHHRASEQDISPIVPPFTLGIFGVPLPGTSTAIVRDLSSKVSTQELRLVSNGDQKLNWTVGAYHKDDQRLRDQGFASSIPLAGILSDQAFTREEAEAKAWAAFGDLEYRLLPELALQLGVRQYKSDNTQVDTDETTSLIFGTSAGLARHSSGSSTATSPKIGLSWKLNPQAMIFVRIADGFRDGGSNYVIANEPSIVPAFGPEKIRAYELGVKAEPLKWLTFNSSVYQNKWTDLQLTFSTPDGLFNYIQNAGKATATGGEIEVVARPVRGLRMGLNLAYVDSTIDSDVLDTLMTPVARKGAQIPQVPKTQAAVFAGYDFPLTASLGGSVSANFSHRGSTYSDPANAPALQNSSLDNLYLRLGINGQWWGVGLFTSNLTDNKGTINKTYFPLTAAPYGTYVQPRTVGVDFNAAF